MISYSARAAKALGFLKQTYNDIEIFVEDTANPMMWLRLLKCVLPEHIKLQSVNLMGGKSNVINACKMDQSNDNRRKLYIIDADFDHLANRRKPRLKHLYRLNSYCVENIILHPHCVAQVCLDCSTSTNQNAAYNEIDYPGMIGAHEELLRSLFLIYAASQEVGAGVPTVQFSIHRLMTKAAGLWHLDAAKVRARIRQVVRDSIRAVGLNAFSSKRRELQFRSRQLPFDQVVSGKDCILPIVWKRLCSKFGYRGNSEQFKVHLAKEFKSEFEPWLSRRIRKIAA